MAIFNPDAGGVPSPNMPDQTGASRGIDTNRSFEYLFKGAADAIGGVASAIDTDIKTSITNETTSIYDSVNKPYTDTVPAELQGQGAAIKSLQTALEQGKISDTYYYGQLTTLTKKMRAKYPGYEQFVDDTIQSVTGVRPANAYRNALLQDIRDQQNAATDEEKFWRQWEKENEEFIVRVTPDYFENPDKYDRAMVRSEVARLKGVDSQVASDKAAIELSISQNNLSDQRATEVGVNTLNQTVYGFMNGVGNAVGFNGNDVMKKIGKMASTGFSGEELQQVVAQISQAEATLRMQLEKQWTSPLSEGSPNSFSSILPGKGKELIDEAMRPFMAIKQMITDGDLGLAGYYTRTLAANQNQELSRVLNASPDLQTAMALKEISNDLALQFINESGKQVGIFKDIAPEVSGRIVTGKDTLNESVDRVLGTNATSVDKTGFVNATLDSLTTAITSGEATPDQVTNSVKSLYALDSEGKDVWSYVNPSEYMRLYNRMFNPVMTQAITANGTPEDLKTYFTAAAARVTAIPELRKAAANFGDSNSSWRDFYEVKLDPTSNRFTLDVKKEGVPLADLQGNAGHSGLWGMVEYTFNKKTIEESVNALNNALDTLGNIGEAAGMSPEEKSSMTKGIITQLNVDLEQGKKGGFFEWLNQSVGDVMTDTDEEQAKLGNQLDDVALNLPEAEGLAEPITGDVITDTIIGFEGFRPTPYWDVNANRVGYGSDTITDREGNMRTVEPGMSVSREDAARDLNRRLTTEFIPGIVEDIGTEKWQELTPNQQAALASIAYNYGSLPSKVVKAVKKGEPQEVVEAIRELQVHNQGINRKRRLKEASMYGSGITAGIETGAYKLPGK